MGMMSLLASDAGVDAGRCMRMALVHDVAEAIVGDITPHCQVSDEDKYRLEADAIAHMKQMLGPHTHAGGAGRGVGVRDAVTQPAAVCSHCSLFLTVRSVCCYHVVSWLSGVHDYLAETLKAGHAASLAVLIVSRIRLSSLT